MFSGIVEESATVAHFDSSVEPARLVVQSKLDHAGTKLGDSIAINGVCLTVVVIDQGRLSFDLAQETLRRSTLGQLKIGSKVNLERSLSLGDRLHGHFVFGHVDTTADLISREADGSCDRLTFNLPAEYAKYVVTKGSISISGVSLTVGETSPGKFCVYIVPHTAQVTTLAALNVGEKVNIEIDMLARYVNAALAQGNPDA